MARRLAQEPGIGVMNDVILNQVAIRFGVDRPTGAGDALTSRNRAGASRRDLLCRRRKMEGALDHAIVDQLLGDDRE